ncbi:OB-fold nucleic acid binding domain-containing protein [Georgenia wangjunii]|uniref:OB-fold nucleic acid binding domain-containing protein n=1 Tax=Georgenia wangjunii TaxID=3117730 RepID=UPI002F263882
MTGSGGTSPAGAGERPAARDGGAAARQDRASAPQVGAAGRADGAPASDVSGPVRGAGALAPAADEVSAPVPAAAREVAASARAGDAGGEPGAAAGQQRTARAERPPALPGGRSRGLQRLLASTAELDAEDERAAAWSRGATPLAEVRPRTRVKVAGVLSAVTYRPKEGMRALVGRLYDGSASVDLVWLGRRTVPGIEPGRRLLAEGMVFAGRARPTIFNPAYELIPEEPRP